MWSGILEKLSPPKKVASMPLGSNEFVSTKKVAGFHGHNFSDLLGLDE